MLATWVINEESELLAYRYKLGQVNITEIWLDALSDQNIKINYKKINYNHSTGKGRMLINIKYGVTCFHISDHFGTKDF